MIDSILAEGQTVTIKTKRPNPTLLNYLSDPYGIIFDMEAGITDDGIVVGTGPYKVTKLVSGETIELVRNEKYWNGTPGFDQVKVLTISDGDTLTMALQSGEIDGAYGMPYASYPIFQKGGYTFTSTPHEPHVLCAYELQEPDCAGSCRTQGDCNGRGQGALCARSVERQRLCSQRRLSFNFAFGGDSVKAKPTIRISPEQRLTQPAGWIQTATASEIKRPAAAYSLAHLSEPSGAAPACRIRSGQSQGDRH